MKLKPLPNIPYIIDGDFFLSEHDTAIKYIVKRHPDYLSLLGIGKGKNDEFKVDQTINFTNDIRQALRDLLLNPNREALKSDVLEKQLPKFKQLIELKGNNTFLHGYLTTVDFKF